MHNIHYSSLSIGFDKTRLACQYVQTRRVKVNSKRREGKQLRRYKGRAILNLKNTKTSLDAFANFADSDF
jgi:hypothetical protein